MKYSIRQLLEEIEDNSPRLPDPQAPVLTVPEHTPIRQALPASAWFLVK